MRTQLATPEGALLSPEAYDQLFTMHGTTMIFLFASADPPGFSNYLVPLMIGSRDMAFPRLNAFSYWASCSRASSSTPASCSAWAPTAAGSPTRRYTEPQYSPGLNMDFYAARAALPDGLHHGGGDQLHRHHLQAARARDVHRPDAALLNWSTLTISVATALRAPARSPPRSSSWSWSATSASHFFDADPGGNPLLWQHLFWIFGHPWVYIVVLPATGMVSMIIPPSARRPHRRATPTWRWPPWPRAIVGFGVWVHHMFATGLPSSR